MRNNGIKMYNVSKSELPSTTNYNSPLFYGRDVGGSLISVYD